jgi:cytochrome c peroxidase
MKNRYLSLGLVFALASPFISSQVYAASPESIISQYGEQAAKEVSGFTGFSAEMGKEFFLANPNTGKPDTPSCTTCHTKSPLSAGESRAGKAIEPMALSKSPERYSDPEKIEKWFRRNCTSVLGRECTALEKGNFLTFMISQ